MKSKTRDLTNVREAQQVIDVRTLMKLLLTTYSHTYSYTHLEHNQMGSVSRHCVKTFKFKMQSVHLHLRKHH